MDRENGVIKKGKKTMFQKMGKTNKTKTIHIFSYIILTIAGFTMILPFLWMISAAFKPEVDIFSFPIKWIPENPTLDNVKAIFSQKYNFALYYFNSFKIATIVTVIQLFTCSFAAYAFSKINFPGRDKIFLCYLGTLMVPFQVTMIPLFIIMKNLRLIDTHYSLILMSAFSAYGVFLLRQFYLGIPDELCEAAKLDGCGHFMIYSKIMLPNIKPAMATLGIFTFLGQWNDFLAPLIFLKSKSILTIPLGLKIFVSEYNVEFGKMMAGTSIALIPVIIVFFIGQKYFVEGIAMTGVKG